MAHRNPPWERDEIILALDLYFRTDFRIHLGKSGEKKLEIVELSDLLNALPIHPVREDGEHFRNLNSVYMKMSNFLRLDPKYPGTGLDAGSRRDKEVWEEFSANLERLHLIAEAIRRNLGSPESQLARLPTEGDDEAQEGKMLFRLQATRERSQGLVQRRKQLALDRYGTLQCDVCTFDFQKMYGALGAGFIECHHTIPLFLLTPGQATRLNDLALTCSNCHRTLHRGDAVLGIAGLRQIVERIAAERGR